MIVKITPTKNLASPWKILTFCVILASASLTLSSCGSGGQSSALQTCETTVQAWEQWYSPFIYSPSAQANQTINDKLGGYSADSGQGGTIPLNAYVQSEVISAGSVQPVGDMCKALARTGNNISNLPMPPG